MENETKNQTMSNEKEMFESDQSARNEHYDKLVNSECSDDDSEIDDDNDNELHVHVIDDDSEIDDGSEINDEIDYNKIIEFHYFLIESMKKKIIKKSYDLVKLKEETNKTMNMINYLLDRSNTLNKRFLERMKQDKIDEDTLNLQSKQILKMIRNLCS